jgi:hypothetical protein
MEISRAFYREKKVAERGVLLVGVVKRRERKRESEGLGVRMDSCT